WSLCALVPLAQAGQLGAVTSCDLIDLARRTMTMLNDGAILADGTCANFVTRDGRPTTGFTGPRLHCSVFADLFVALGNAGLARHDDNPRWATVAEDLLTSAARRIARGTALSEPYPVRSGLVGFAPWMILCNTATEVYRATGSKESAGIAAAAVEMIIERFMATSDVAELAVADPGLADTVEARHRNPGHVLECLWFLADAAIAVPEVAGRWGPELDARLVEALDFAASRGWDTEHGGLHRYVDVNGGRPSGRRLGGAYEHVVLDTWSRKLWWPHNDGLYAALLLWSRTNSTVALEWARRLDEYAFSRFPVGPGAEWNQILTREGTPRPASSTDLLPVKDPFHLIRSLLLSAELGRNLT